MDIGSTPNPQPKGGGKVRLRTLADVDRRTLAAKEVFGLRDSIASDLGGADRLTAMEREIVDNAAMIGAMLKDAAASWLSGEPTDLSEFQTLANCQRRLLETIGLRRRAKDVTPSLDAYLGGRA
ncbi:hypothetical protein EN814_16375 [Mesorhizobium sp. M2D.F.Ca.ET.171.01.1.1]|nr:hypothetical protein EN821_16390 [Mesorhizobium sp. M2D.F.Ca.ET.178.01.1.1]TGT11057.1 hypothetical protein EN814_16375 [Mesorhizobium sp. M2D.F.Ca.ET.171.01.1.1]